MPKVPIARNILAANDTTAEAIQRRLVAHGIRTLNLMSSPGSLIITTLLVVITRGKSIAPVTLFGLILVLLAILTIFVFGRRQELRAARLRQSAEEKAVIA